MQRVSMDDSKRYHEQVRMEDTLAKEYPRSPEKQNDVPLGWMRYENKRVFICENSCEIRIGRGEWIYRYME